MVEYDNDQNCEMRMYRAKDERTRDIRIDDVIVREAIMQGGTVFLLYSSVIFARDQVRGSSSTLSNRCVPCFLP